ncbi:MAG TPA: class I SAM-dependent methyltransferase [Planctomycetaceae bacterium]|nr:class I SAM-dependent methyltransferase [Planctomycetaceae bacterium]
MELSATVPWGRSFDEYVRMFALDESDLERRIIGCGDGPAAFNAEMKRRGKYVVSVDPLYGFTAEQIRQRIDEIYDQMVAGARAKADAFHWTDFRSPDELGRRRLEVMETFLADFPDGLHDGRYIAASLPELPFGASSFDLAVCSHLLFTYSQLLSEDVHFAAIVEMCRVAAEARIFPVLDMFDGGRSPHLDAVIRRLRLAGFTVELVRVPYEFQRGGNEMLRVLRR